MAELAHSASKPGNLPLFDDTFRLIGHHAEFADKAAAGVRQGLAIVVDVAACQRGNARIWRAAVARRVPAGMAGPRLFGASLPPLPRSAD